MNKLINIKPEPRQKGFKQENFISSIDFKTQSLKILKSLQDISKEVDKFDLTKSDIEIYNLNNKLLQAINADWFKLGPIRKNELLEINNLRYEAIQLLEKKFSDRDLFAIKDPRFCILLPFWKSVFTELNLKVDYIFAIRNPLSVSLSLLKRNTI